MCRTNHEFDDYYFTVYDQNDDYLFSFENIDDFPKFFNYPLKEFLRKLKNNSLFMYDGKLVKIFVQKKFIEKEIIVRRR